MLVSVLTKSLCTWRIWTVEKFCLFVCFVVNKVQAIVYCTCSVYPEENELVVKKALESGVEGNKIQPYRYGMSSFVYGEIKCNFKL